ncbi:glycoside hydrolase family 3 protein [Sphingobacterium sp. DR205]|uniref:glycoside hydrolase family 3 protein n=1 Tax=Sphingobacterium sp. DR205 TaxID=2713573 RepID=UPI001F4937FA|nr:glycoside hydrolase family 3 protein [Sphingobacterium sp. DR205]
MKIFLYKWLVCSALLGFTKAFGQGNAPQLGKSSISEVIGAMTLEEKAKLLVGTGMKLPSISTDGSAIGHTDNEVAGAAGTTLAIPRLGIPSIVLADGPAGVRIDSIRRGSPKKTYYATAWPVGTLLASSWDTELVTKVGTAFGGEARAYGVDIMLAPALNIHRNPLGGRNFEYYSEDPMVTGRIAAAMVRGIQSQGVGTSIKHFAANNQETNRFTVNTIVSERALREIYLRGFELAIKESNPWTVMTSYNLINGTYTSESSDLLNTVLNKEWGYKGLVMTDWFGGDDPVAQMVAGNHLLMPGVEKQTKGIIDAVKEGRLSEKVLDRNVAVLLGLILRTQTFAGHDHGDNPDLKANALLARRAAAESMVLLKNEKTALPLKSTDSKIALFGNNGYELIAGGTGSGDVNKAYTISLNDGLTGAGYQVDAELQREYTGYLRDQALKHPKKSFFAEIMNPTPPPAEFNLRSEVVARKAEESDIAVIAIGRIAGEQRDRQLAGDYELTPAELSLVRSVTEAFHAKNKKVVVVLNIGGVIDVASWRTSVDAILLAWQPGLEGGNAIADVLSGKINPSGKLATTFPVSYKEVPSAKNFPGRDDPEKARPTGVLGAKLPPAEVIYEEGIYVGYRYYNTFGVATAYPFGYGLFLYRFFV